MVLSELEFTKFPGGEIGFEIKNTRQHEDMFTARLKTPEDIVKLIVCSEPILRFYPKIKLFIPYFPYGRQDRIERPGESFTLRAITNVINSLGYSQIWIADPHSDVTPALIKNCRVIHQKQIVKMVMDHVEKLKDFKNIVVPDAGAAKKIDYSLHENVLTCTKIRDTRTGKLSGFKLYADTVPEECTILDDICDGGGTFIEIAKLLRKRGAKKVNLYVTHGIFSRGLEVFDGLIDKIYTTNSYGNKEIEKRVFDCFYGFFNIMVDNERMYND